MTVQVFRGRTLEEARRSAVAALGEDAVVVSTRNVRHSGLTGLLGRLEVEIAATAPPPEPPARAKPAAKSAGPFVAAAYVAPEKPARDALAALRSELRNEVRTLRNTLSRGGREHELASEIAALRQAVAGLRPADQDGGIVSAIRDLGFEGEVAADLLRRVRDRTDASGLSLGERLRDAVAELVPVAPLPITVTGGRGQVVALVGFSGVGKTTTLAKLAAHALENGLSVTFVTCDTFRVGGTEHARRYAGLLDIPFRMARTPLELRDVVTRCPSDVVLVDTSGREPTSDAAESWLAPPSFDATPETHGMTRQVLLCVPAGIRARDAAHAVDVFGSLQPSALAVTKLDETEQPAGVVHATFAARLPISLLSIGPRVPEDLAPATKGRLLDALLHTAETQRSAA